MNLLRSLIQALLYAVASMTAFEVTKQLIHPTISIWESHIVTIIFSSAVATVISFFIWRRQEQFQRQLLEEIQERQKTEDTLYRAREELEIRVEERTAELAATNAALQIEVNERQQAEQLARGQTAVTIRRLQLLATEPTLDTFLGHVLTATAEQLNVFSVSLYLCNRDNDTAHLQLSYYEGRILSDKDRTDTSIAPPSRFVFSEDPIPSHIAQTQEPFVIEEVAESPLPSGIFQSWAQRVGVSSVLVTPLLAENTLIGAIGIFSRARRNFSSEEIALAQALAHQTTLALQITRLAEQNQRAVLLAERNRMAREIHDTLSQGFTGIVIQLEGAEDILDEAPYDTETLRSHLARARTLARDSLMEARRSVWELRPQLLEQEDLTTALTRLVEQLAADTTVQLSLSLQGVPYFLPPQLEDSFFRISREALSNALRHAQAQNIRIALIFDDQHVTLKVEDDGRGFDSLEQSQRGFGLLSMQERAERVGGTVTITSQPERGTTMQMVVPRPERRLPEV